MKSIYLLLFFLPGTITAFGQATTSTTMRIENMKDAWELPVTYVGEVKNGKPNGLGIFIYHTGPATRYAGYFAEGLPQGKGALLFEDNAFLWGDWSKGKLQGRGANLTSDGDLYLGQFANGLKNGKGILIFKDNGISKGSFLNDKLDGRGIFINSAAKIINDNIYVNDEKNGPGYQYELDPKKLFKGRWENDKWVAAGEVFYHSFLTDSRFRGEQSAKQVLMGSVNAAGNVEDTAFFRNNERRTRNFGIYSNGHLRDGLIIREDSTVFYGQLNDIGATGFCSFFKRDKYFDEGIFKDDYLNGSQSLSIDLVKKSIYYGSTIGKGEFTGKSWFSNNKCMLFRGDYLLGKLTGSGSRTDSMGFCTTGTWKEGKLQQLTRLTGPDGKTIPATASTLGEAIFQLVRLHGDEFSPIEGEEVFDDFLQDMDYSGKSFYKPMAAAKANYIMEYEGSLAHISVLYELADGKAAAARYEALCKQLSTTKVTLKPGAAPLTLTTADAKIPVDDANSVTNFSLTNEKGKPGSICMVMVIQLYDEDTKTFKVMLAVGDEDAVAGLMILF